MNLIADYLPPALASWLGVSTASKLRRADAAGDVSALIRAGTPQGQWSGALSGFVPRQINPHLYEAMRESLPILDGAISTTVTLDGIVRVEGNNDKLVAEIEDFISHIPVNDNEKGIQAFYETQGNEKYEQGFGVGEIVMARNGRDIAGLRVADSKGIYFRRTENGLETHYRPPGEPIKQGGGLENVEMLLRNGALPHALHAAGAGSLVEMGYTQLDPRRLIYTVNQPESDNPYGTSLLRSLEFGGKTLLTIQNAINNVWTRYGDPVMVVVYKVANPQVLKTEGALDRRQNDIAKLIRTAMEAKGSGNSVDIVQAIGKDDDFKLEVIGAEGIALEIEAPARHLLEQIVAKVQIPAFMLGLQFSTSERMAEQQAGMAIQAAKTRWVRRQPSLNQLITTMLRQRGRTWKPGDWKLTQELPNITDKVKEAQSQFLLAQTELMRSQAGSAPVNAPKPAGIDNNLRHYTGGTGKSMRAVKAPTAPIGEDWADDDAELPRIEQNAVRRLLTLWAAVSPAVTRALNLDDASDEWAYQTGMMPALLDAEAAFLRAATGDAGAVNAALVEIWQRGLANAAEQAGADAPISTLTEEIARALRERGGAQIRTTEVRVLRERIINVIAAGAMDGLPPASIAKELERLFGMAEYDWQLLVSSELVAAYGDAKEAEMIAQGLEKYDWTTAGDGDVCATCARHRDNGPYVLGQGPKPMHDSHPLCRCAMVPAL